MKTFEELNVQQLALEAFKASEAESASKVNARLLKKINKLLERKENSDRTDEILAKIEKLADKVENKGNDALIKFFEKKLDEMKEEFQAKLNEMELAHNDEMEEIRWKLEEFKTDADAKERIKAMEMERKLADVTAKLENHKLEHSHDDGKAKVRLFWAKFDYDDGDFSFKQGDCITIYGDMDEDRFYSGELNGKRGLVPSTFVTDENPPHFMSSAPQSLAAKTMNSMQQQPMVPTRYLWANLDYDARNMSPNVDGEQAELSFKKGDLIAIFGDVDEDGFYFGEVNGLRGLVPSNFVTESGCRRTLPARPTTLKLLASRRMRRVHFEPKESVQYVWAKWDYDPARSSPNVDGERVELSFKKGDCITIQGEKDEDEFYFGELNGLRGLVPSNFVTDPVANLAPANVKKVVNAISNKSSMTSKTSGAKGTTKSKAKKSTAKQGSKAVAKKTNDARKNSATRETSTWTKRGIPLPSSDLQSHKPKPQCSCCSL